MTSKPLKTLARLPKHAPSEMRPESQLLTRSSLRNKILKDQEQELLNTFQGV